jgi:hypothetical protein
MGRAGGRGVGSDSLRAGAAEMLSAFVRAFLCDCEHVWDFPGAGLHVDSSPISSDRDL